MLFKPSFFLVAFSLCLRASLAATVTYNWTVSWVKANPDGLYERDVIGINGKWPLPPIIVNKGDRIVVHMHNQLGNRNASIHFHGMYQNGTTHMDGPAFVTQCPVPSNHSITYNFSTGDNVGTYWYHSHVDSQYPDGYRAPLIIRDPDAYFNDDYDEEYTITMSDWYHELIDTIDPSFLSLYNPSGAEPIPDYFLFNETTGGLNFSIEPGKTYLFRLMNVGAFVARYFEFQGHTFKIVEIDGVYTEPTEAELLYISVAQRYSVLLTAKNSTDKNYPIVSYADADLLDKIPSDLKLNSTSWLEYNKDADHPEGNITVDAVGDFEPFDDSTLIPYDRMARFEDPDYEITVNVTMNNLDNGINYAFFNNITYTTPKVPSLYTAISAGDLNTNALVYGTNTNSFVLKHNDVVQITLNNQDSGSHPFHLHGHVFQVLYRSPTYADDDITPFDASNSTLIDSFAEYPARRDVLVAHPNGNFVIRFRADNPGVWYFHCHIEWHLHQGLSLVLVEAPELLRDLTIPDDHLAACEALGIATAGNAAGNDTNFLNLAGEPTQVKDLPSGMTARGIVALVFSCICAFVGMGSIVWYGLSDLSLSEAKMVKQIEQEAGIDEDVDPDDMSAHFDSDEYATTAGHATTESNTAATR